jgi:hypothetical protein
VTTKLELVKPAHAPLSPSKAHRWLVCPGSQLVSSDDPETEWAATGHHKHEVLRLIMRGEPVVAGDVVEGREVELETIEQCVEIKEYVAQWRTHHPDWEVREEVQLEVGAPTWGLPPDECRGTGDVVGWGWDEMLVLDAKFGWVQVEARGNAQLYLYALGALAQSLYPVKSVCLIIAQPDYSGEVVFKEERTTPERLYQWALENQGAMEEARSGSRRLQADDTACRYCPARTYCPARLKALEDFNSDEWMQAHKLEDLLPYLPRIEAIVRDLKAKAVERLAERATGAGLEARRVQVQASLERRGGPLDHGPGGADRLGTGEQAGRAQGRRLRGHETEVPGQGREAPEEAPPQGRRVGVRRGVGLQADRPAQARPRVG